MLAISLFTCRIIELGFEPGEIVLLVLTLLVSTVNFDTERTYVLKGAVHLIIFISYIVLSSASFFYPFRARYFVIIGSRSVFSDPHQSPIGFKAIVL